MADLFTAFDISGLSANVSTALVTGIGVVLLFVGFKAIKRVARSL